MPFVPRLSVGQRLTLAMVLVVVLSWLLGGLLIYQLVRFNLLNVGRSPPRARSEVAVRSDLRGDGGEIDIERIERPAPHERSHRPPPFWRMRTLLIHLGVGVAMAVAAGIWLSRRFTRPLAKLAEGAGALGAGRFSHRIPVVGNDEFGRVANSMNEMAERIGEQIEALEADARRRQHLLADVAHELRTPVATLKTMAEALRDGIASAPERTERAAHAIAESAERMERLVKDLLELARLDLDELPLYPQSVDLCAAAADAIRRHADAAARAGVILRRIQNDGRVIVSTDPHRLAQILDNLLDNAVSHAGRDAEVSVILEDGDPVSLTVADTGRGISPEHLAYLFDAFYRGDTARTPGDHHSGLGLRIARSLARAHGGDLVIESAEGQGTRAILTLPKQSNHSPDGKASG